ncbi:MAG: glycosyltransferase family A protein [Fulvivirga sp.]
MMTDSIPKISIIMPVYNRADLIRESLDSILKQTYSNWECIIVDDGSTDDTPIVVKPILERDKRFKFYRRSDKYLKGPSGSRNMGLDIAKGDYLVFVDSDDIVHPDMLQICWDLLDDEDAFFCRYNKTPFRGEWKKKAFDRNMDIDVDLFSIKDIAKMVTNQTPFACCTVMWQKSAIGDSRFNEKLSYAEEWEFYTRILSTGVSGISLNQSLYFNRKHSSSNTGEFWANDPVRKASKILAVKLVIDQIQEKKLLSPFLVKHFLQTGFFLKAPSIIDYILEKTDAGVLKKIKYKLGYILYPVVRPVLKFKGFFKP